LTRERSRLVITAQLRRPAGEFDVAPVQPRQALTTYLAVFTVDPLIANPDELAGAPIARTMIGGWRRAP
jgi:hypothetical protein